MKDKMSVSAKEEHQDPKTEERTFTCSECG
jgi:hypothetical protein